PHAHARREPSAASRALHRIRARDRLHGEPLHAMPGHVAADAREPRIDDETDAGHGERSLGYVRGQHDARLAPRLEDAVLTRRREPRIERQYFVLGVDAGSRE